MEISLLFALLPLISSFFLEALLNRLELNKIGLLLLSSIVLADFDDFFDNKAQKPNKIDWSQVVATQTCYIVLKLINRQLYY